MTRAFFVAGTDTEVGKTLIATALLHAARERGLSTLGLKPVSAGCVEHHGQWVNDDALALQAESSLRPEYAVVNPLALQPAIAPHIAAAAAGLQISAKALIEHCRQALATHAPDFAVVEGAGGWLVPLNYSETMADLAAGVGLPVILVVGMRLGCLNHSLLTATAIGAAGLELAGWVANFPQPMRDARANVEALRERLTAPCVGCVPSLAGEISPAAAAGHLDLDLLLAGA